MPTMMPKIGEVSASKAVPVDQFCPATIPPAIATQDPDHRAHGQWLAPTRWRFLLGPAIPTSGEEAEDGGGHRRIPNEQGRHMPSFPQTGSA